MASWPGDSWVAIWQPTPGTRARCKQEGLFSALHGLLGRSPARPSQRPPPVCLCALRRFWGRGLTRAEIFLVSTLWVGGSHGPEGSAVPSLGSSSIHGIVPLLGKEDQGEGRAVPLVSLCKDLQAAAGLGG